jgi:hypothetical protein
MDDRALKLFAKLDADFPAERVQALEILRAHLQKTGQSFRDIVRDIGNAAAATLKNAELQIRGEDPQSTRVGRQRLGCQRHGQLLRNRSAVPPAL